MHSSGSDCVSDAGEEAPRNRAQAEMRIPLKCLYAALPESSLRRRWSERRYRRTMRRRVPSLSVKEDSRLVMETWGS